MPPPMLTGIDAAELRRRNLIAPDKMPYTTAFGNTYDSGDFPGAFERALTLADYAGFGARRRRRRRPANCAASASAATWRSPARFRKKPRASAFPAAARCNVSIGSGASGQAHQTVFGKVAARRLGIAPEAVSLLAGDSARDVPGFGAVASRSAMMWAAPSRAPPTRCWKRASASPPCCCRRPRATSTIATANSA